MNIINQQKTKAGNTKAKQKHWLNYTIKALKPISSTTTTAIIEQTNVLGKELQQALLLNNMLVDFFLIGGITNNTHIKQKETVDVLLLFKGYKEKDNIKADYPSLKDIQLLRHNTEVYLKTRFPEAQFDNSLSLSLKLNNLPLSCNFCFYFGYSQTNKTQAFGDFSHNKTELFNSELLIFEKSEPLNSAKWLMIKNDNTNGNTIPLIRILKKLKVDAQKPITLTGHEITCIVYSMEDYTLTKQPGQIIFMLLEVSLFLKLLIDDPFMKRNLKDPNGDLITRPQNDYLFTREVYKLKNEVDLLIKHLIHEIDLYTNIYSNTIMQ